jgi:tetratricopeptide (TPR) repeat protein
MSTIAEGFIISKRFFNKNGEQIILGMLGILFCLLLFCSLCVGDEADYFYWMGLKAHSSKNYSDALVYFDKAVGQNPRYLEAWIAKGNTLKAIKEYNASIDSYSKALQIDGNNSAALNGIIESYASLKEYGKASFSAIKLREQNPENKNYLLREGNLLQAQGKFADAVFLYDRALALDPEFKDALYGKGISQFALGEVTIALALFDLVLKLDPNHKNALIGKALALEALRDHNAALSVYSRVQEIDPKLSRIPNDKIHSQIALYKFQEIAAFLVKNK